MGCLRGVAAAVGDPVCVPLGAAAVALKRKAVVYVAFGCQADLSSKEAQDAFLGTCRRLRELDCRLTRCNAAGYDKLAMAVGGTP